MNIPLPAPTAKKNNSIGYWLKDKAPYLVVFIMSVLIIILYFFSNIVIQIHSGEAGVMYRRFFGTDTNHIYPERLHIIPPWDNMYVYNMRVQTVLHELTVLTNKGLPITLSLAIRYRPEYDMVGLLHKDVGPDYVNVIIIPEIESVLRRNIGQLNPEDVYTNKKGVLNKIMRLAIDETSRKYVTVDDIIIRWVQLPPKVEQAISTKLVEEQVLKKYEYLLKIEAEEAKRKKIEAQGINTYQAIVRETLSDQLIKWQAVHATQNLVESENAKVVIIGAGEQGLPVILGNDWGDSKKTAPESKQQPKETLEEEVVEESAPPATTQPPLNEEPTPPEPR